MLHKVDPSDCTLSFLEFTLQKVDACDYTLSFAEFGLWLAPKANQGTRGPTIIITPQDFEILLCLLFSYMNSHFNCRLSFYF